MEWLFLTLNLGTRWASVSLDSNIGCVQKLNERGARSASSNTLKSSAHTFLSAPRMFMGLVFLFLLKQILPQINK